MKEKVVFMFNSNDINNFGRYFQQNLQLNRNLTALREKFLSKQQPNNNSDDIDVEQQSSSSCSTSFSAMPPLDISTLSSSFTERAELFFQNVRIGDVLVAVVSSVELGGASLKLLCTTCADFALDLHDLNLQVFLPRDEFLIDCTTPGGGMTFEPSDLIKVAVASIDSLRRKLTVLLKSSANQSKLGLISENDLPPFIRSTSSDRRYRRHHSTSLSKLLKETPGFSNPSAVDYLAGQLGLPFLAGEATLFDRKPFGDGQMASGMRQTQNRQQASLCVARGVQRLRNHQPSQALQHFNQALQADPSNVDTLVARGALYANSNSFELAVRDLQHAVELDAENSNAKKYLIDCLVSQAKDHEAKAEWQPAVDCYRQVLSIDASIEVARVRLKLLENKLQISESSTSSEVVFVGSYPSATGASAAESAAADNRKIMYDLSGQNQQQHRSNSGTINSTRNRSRSRSPLERNSRNNITRRTNSSSTTAAAAASTTTSTGGGVINRDDEQRISTGLRSIEHFINALKSNRTQKRR